MKDTVTLQTGILIEECQAKLAEFCRKDFSYKNYDLPSNVLEDDELTESDIQFANRMVARMGPLVVQSIFEKRKTINSVLSLIRPGTSITDEDIPWALIEELFRVILGPEVGPARATKILHKKRPALIPILDSVVVSYCRAVSQAVLAKNEASRMTTYVRVVKHDIDRNLNVLKQTIQACNIKITPVRALDILLWGYSGEYENTFHKPPLWKR